MILYSIVQSIHDLRLAARNDSSARTMYMKSIMAMVTDFFFLKKLSVQNDLEANVN